MFFFTFEVKPNIYKNKNESAEIWIFYKRLRTGLVRHVQQETQNNITFQRLDHSRIIYLCRYPSNDMNEILKKELLAMDEEDQNVLREFQNVMDELILLTDGSVNTQENFGYGAYLAVSERGLPLDSLRASVKVRLFEHTSSTKLELQTLLWALSDIQALGRKVTVYTDSQNIMGLQGRRDRLEKNDYFSKKNKRLNNYELYQEFYSMIDQLDCEFVKVRGHKAASQKNDIDRLFTLVDKASRNALRGDKR